MFDDRGYMAPRQFVKAAADSRHCDMRDIVFNAYALHVVKCMCDAVVCWFFPVVLLSDEVHHIVDPDAMPACQEE